MAMAGRRPLYADNQNNVKFDTNDEDFSGWMLKESRWLKDWRRRFFILKGSRLFFAKSETGECHGLIDLTEVITVRPAEFKTEKRNTLEIATQENSFLMCAETEKERDDWLLAIGRAIVQ
ncbi:unnamed protein product, partial [Heterosigma akashiwo]